MLFFCSILPIVTALVLMTKFKMKPGLALPVSLCLTALSGFFVWDMPLMQIFAVSIFGVLKSLDIILIVFSAVFLLNILKRNNAMEIINNTFAGISPDRRIQMVIIAWLFSSFIEGAAGFGSAPALAAPLLAGLGFPIVSACIAALVGNTLPVPFGAVGTPTITLNSILQKNITSSGLEVNSFCEKLLTVFTDISLFSGIFLPFIMVAFVILLDKGKGKWRACLEILPFCLFSGIVYFVPWKMTAMYLGPELPSMLGAMIALPAVILLLKLKVKFLVPHNVWEFSSSVPCGNVKHYSFKEYLSAWSAYLLIAAILVLTRLPMLPLKKYLTSFSLELSSIFGVAGTQFKWAIFYNPGLFPILFVALLLMLVSKDKKVFQVAGDSGKQVLQASIAIAVSFSIVQIMIFSNEQPEGIPGMLNVIATAAAECLGRAYIFAAPFIGVLGTFFSGSCTVSNILFGSIQFDSAFRAGLPPDVVTALQNIGGGIGSMIRISGVVATTATVNAAGKEGKILCLNCIPVAVMVLLALLGAFICM